MRTRLLALLPLVAACGLSEDSFQDEFATKTCAVRLECAAQANAAIEESWEDTGAPPIEDLGTADTCASYTSFELSSLRCTYNKAAAKGCLAALDDLTCGQAPDKLDACQQVYSGGEDCDWGGPAGGADTGADTGA